MNRCVHKELLVQEHHHIGNSSQNLGLNTSGAVGFTEANKGSEDVCGRTSFVKVSSITFKYCTNHSSRGILDMPLYLYHQMRVEIELATRIK